MKTERVKLSAVRRKTQIRKGLLVEALKKSMGRVAPACRACGLSRTQFYEYVNTDPIFAGEVKALELDMVKFAEVKLYEKIKQGDLNAVIFYLKTKGSNLGYVE